MKRSIFATVKYLLIKRIKMKKVLMAAALILGTFFSVNAEVNSFEDFGCVTSREIVKVTITWDHNGNQHIS